MSPGVSAAARRLGASLIPGGLLFLAGAVVCAPGVAPSAWESTLRAIPVAAGGLAFLLGCFFRRSRIVFSAVLLAVTELAIRGIGDQWGSPGTPGRLAYAATAVLLPVNLLLLALRRERGVFNVHGQTRLGMIALQVIAIGAAIRLGWRPASEWLEARYLGGVLEGWTDLPEAAVVTGGVAVAILLARNAMRRDPIEAGCLWALVSGGVALHGLRWGWASMPTLGAGGVVLIWSLLGAAYRMAYIDDLTELPGRRALEEALLSLGSVYTIAMVDVDHFKRFNDLFGHEVGDQALRMVAARLRDVEGGGSAFRYGGEEFAVLFAGSSLEDAARHLEALRHRIATTPFIVRGPGRSRRKPAAPRATRGPHVAVCLTVSIGAAQRDGRKGPADAHAVLRAADKALYRAKRSGRNRLVT